MRKKIIAGNWKLNKSIDETTQLVDELKLKIGHIDNVDIVVCPTFLGLQAAIESAKDSRIGVGAQNVFWENEGAFTGEVSGPMLSSAGCDYAIIGHSERRQFFGETDETVNKRINAALQSNLKAIVCVGESLEEREASTTFDVIGGQLEGAFRGIGSAAFTNIIVAYEPVWAIGTGKTASPEQAEDVHAFIRNTLEKAYDKGVAGDLCVQYGGSVKPGNAFELLSMPNIDGALVGGASLDAVSFAGIVEAAAEIK